MRALVVYESMFGNNQAIATAITEGLAPSMHADVVEVGTAPTTISSDVDLIVVGAPTHAFGLSNAKTRESAAKQAPDGLVSTGIGVREWLAALAESTSGTRALAYDTCTYKPRWVGLLIDRAARSIERQLRQRGFLIAGTSQHFYCSRTPSALLDGEVERARQWGEEVARNLEASRSS